MHKIIGRFRRDTSDAVLYAVMAAYAVILAVLLFGKSDGERAVNFIPFMFVKDFIIDRGVLAFSNIAGNILMFVPLGVYLALLTGKSTVWKSERIVLLVSAAVELLQWIFAAGVADIDDLLLNGIGGLAGIYALRLLEKKLGERTRPAVAYISLAVGVLFLAIFLCLRFGVFGIRIKIL